MTNAKTPASVPTIDHAAHSAMLPMQDADAVRVRAAYQRWIEAVTGGDPETVVRLYAPDAVLLPTFAAEPRATREGLREYFDDFTALPRLRARTDQSLVHVADDVAFHDGLYTFAYEKDGRDVHVRARFSYAYRRRGRDWLIVRHHSSQVPAAVS